MFRRLERHRKDETNRKRKRKHRQLKGSQPWCTKIKVQRREAITTKRATKKNREIYPPNHDPERKKVACARVCALLASHPLERSHALS
ncbi:hypothetical protein CPB84DRAFT_1773877 [Gymnopilus junonius]|uniref:Uncharacterized protein n=1 Tax=Gymnopilus junonius TaxID=109634 RepID=A0A9P5NSM9_GYMJU|nr:hypothetical protein CPB84DRAFT_1773877 [Gymnopilus junonius]